MTSVVCYGAFLTLGAVVSFEDWTHRRIRNRLILAGLLVCLAAALWLLGNSLLGLGKARFLGLGEYFLPWTFYPRLAAHLALSFAAAFALWRLEVWPAGDAKFFTVCAFFIALIDPNLPGFPKVLFLLLLINVFIPAGLVLASESLWLGAARLPEARGFDWRRWLKARADVVAVRVKEAWPYRAEYVVLWVNLVAVFCGLMVGQGRLMRGEPDPLVPLLAFLGICAVWRAVSTVLRDKRVGLALFAGLSVWALGGLATGRWPVLRPLGSALLMTLNFGMFLSLVRIAFYWFIEKQSLRELRPEHLKQGVILSDATWLLLGAEKGLAGKLHPRCVDGLSEGEAAAVREWLAARGGGDYTVYHTIPFAFWIFLGTLLTLTQRVSAVAVLVAGWGRAQELLRAAAERFS